MWVPELNTAIAVGSFNHHRQFFSRRFHFSCRSEPAASACIGFGLERLVYAFLSQRGTDRAQLFDALEQFRARRAARA